jgi:glycosyltransferase involved in cell wall biosynthesis
MKILFVVPYYKPAYIYGGPVVVISLLAENLILLGHQVTIYTTNANGSHDIVGDINKEIVVDGVKVIYFKRRAKNNTFAAPKLWSHLAKTVGDFDVVHIHTWWNFVALGAALVCMNKKIKPIISPHGMLSDYILYKNNAGAKKWLHKLIGKKLLTNSWLHVSTPMEWDESKKIIPDWQGRVISNLIKLSDKEYTRVSNEVFSIGFLSRVDPKKGLDILIKALGKINRPYRLFVAGSGEPEYIDELKDISAECGNYDKITWVGWKSGEDKFEFLSTMDLFALTSHSENFAIVVIESLSVGTPVLVSDQVGLFKYVRDTDFGWVTTMDIDKVAAFLDEIMDDTMKTDKINKQAPGSIKQQYNYITLTNQYLDFYQSIKSI